MKTLTMNLQTLNFYQLFLDFIKLYLVLLCVLCKTFSIFYPRNEILTVVSNDTSCTRKSILLGKEKR